MAADRFDHLFIAPSDFDRTLAFYRDTLGWRVAAHWGGGGAPRGAQLDGGGTRLVIAEPHDAADRSWTHGIHGARPTLHLAVDDVDARYAALRRPFARGRPAGRHALGRRAGSSCATRTTTWSPSSRRASAADRARRPGPAGGTAGRSAVRPIEPGARSC